MKLVQYKSLYDLLEAFPTEQSCIDFLEQLRWNGTPVSPFEEFSKVYKCKNNRYKCSKSGKYFNVRTRSIFESTQLPLRKWFMAIYIFSCHKKGISSYQLGRDLNIKQPTAWHLLHRIRHAFAGNGVFSQLDGITEIDETSITPNPANKHRQGGRQHEPSKGKIIFGAIQRRGNLILKHVPDKSGETLLPIIHQHIKPKTAVFSDGHPPYNNLKSSHIHMSVNHSANEFVRGGVHTNTIESAWSYVKWCIDGSYKHTSEKHFHSYLNELAFRFNRRKLTEREKFESAISATKNGRLRYKDLVGTTKKKPVDKLKTNYTGLNWGDLNNIFAPDKL